MSSIENPQDTFQDYAQGAGRTVTGRAREAVSAAADKASRVAGRAGAAAKAASDFGMQAARTAGHQVEDHPWTSVGVGFAAGILVGIVIDRLISK